ncbi:MAG: HEAT repeat domain-containing protein [Bacteroidales bacterium]|jgi:hypothetical protein|nr:HEAT repeat domain-containing protein [Bacteroidales bacterium]
MKIQALYDLQQEINRLYIAGSKFAQGDPRLQKHVPVLRKLGEKAPVFKKLAEDIEELLQKDARQGADKLASISILLYSVLYTQGETVENDAEEKVQTPAMNINEVNTNYSYLQLKPLIDALVSSHSGRLEVLKDAFERKIFADSRTWQYMDVALADKYSELADYVEKTLIPAIGKPMLPFLLRSFKYEDKTEQARRLRLLYLLGYREIENMTEKILTESLPLLQASAIEIMSANSENETLIVQLADDKNKVVREAAYKALAKLNTRTSLEKLTTIYLKNKNKTNLPLIADALASTRLPFFFQEVFSQVLHSFETFVNLDKNTDDKVLSETLENFQTHLGALVNKNTNGVLQFLSQLIHNDAYEKLITAKETLLTRNASYYIPSKVLEILHSFDQNTQLAFYEENMKDTVAGWKNKLWEDYFCIAFATGYSKEKLYDVFSVPVKKERIGIHAVYSTFFGGKKNDNNFSLREKIDSRWVDIFYELLNKKSSRNTDNEYLLGLIHACEPSNCARFNAQLLELTKRLKPENCIGIFQLLVERKVPDCFEIIYSILSGIRKQSYVYYQLGYAGFWKEFPPAYREKFRDLFEKHKLPVFETIANEIPVS